MGLLGLKLPSSLVYLYLEKTFSFGEILTSAFMPNTYNENNTFEERKQMKPRSSMFSIEFIGEENLYRHFPSSNFDFTLHIKPKSCNIMNIYGTIVEYQHIYYVVPQDIVVF